MHLPRLLCLIWACLFMISSGDVLAQRFPTRILNDTLSLEEFFLQFPENRTHLPAGKDGTRDERPNIIFILLDDCRWDSFTANGGQEYFPTPNIDRIANEGVNFKNFFAVLPLCTPSRGVFFTGMYPHRTGVVRNPDNIKANFAWVSEILQQSGYYTIMSGKLGFSPDSIRGFDQFFINILESYQPSRYSVWTGDTAVKVWIGDHTTDAIVDYAIGKIVTRPPDKPFFLYLPHRAPHVPYVPRPQDEGLFDTVDMPFPENYKKYQNNYPDYYYPDNEAGDSLKIVEDYRGYFELLAGVESVTGVLLDFLESEGLLDNTLIMFTSDNGNLKSEHRLQGKQLPLEESIRLPMFLRYPEWFPEHEDVYDEMGINLDWAKTLLDAAEVPDTFGLDGLSLRALANNEIHRDAFMYEVWSEIDLDDTVGFVNETPSIRAVRTPYYKYVRSNCNVSTEQLFDLVNDPMENTNLINDDYYATVAQYYRCKLDSFRIATQDVFDDTTLVCKLKNIDSAHVGFSQDPGPIGTCIFPVFDQDTTFEVVGTEDELAGDHFWQVTIYNLFGSVLSVTEHYYDAEPADALVLKQQLPPGMYIALFENKHRKMAKKIIVQ